jgi:predicted secreted Zn-dependent protease
MWCIFGGYARTKWEVTWRYGLAQIPGGCRITAVTTSVHVTYRMPRWTNPADGSPELREKWDTFVKALQKHEDGHKDHGIQAAQEVEAAITQLRPLRSCNDIRKAADTTANSIKEKYRKKDLVLRYPDNPRHNSRGGFLMNGLLGDKPDPPTCILLNLCANLLTISWTPEPHLHNIPASPRPPMSVPSAN